MLLSHADLLSILFYLDLPLQLSNDSRHEHDFSCPLRVTQRNYSSDSLVISPPSLGWCTDTAAFLYRCSGLLYSPSHIQNVFERIFFQECNGKLEKLLIRWRERVATRCKEEKGSRQHGVHSRMAHNGAPTNTILPSQRSWLSTMPNGDEGSFPPSAVLLGAANVSVYTKNYMTDKFSDIVSGHDVQENMTNVFVDPTSPRKRDRTSQEFTASSFVRCSTKVFSDVRADAAAKTLNDAPSMESGAVMRTQISTTEDSQTVKREMSPLMQHHGLRRIKNIRGTVDEIRISQPPACATDMAKIVPSYQDVEERDIKKVKVAVGYDPSVFDDDEDEVWLFSDLTPEQCARLHHLRYNTLLSPEVLSNILQQFFLVDGAGVFFLPVPDQTIMEYNEVRSGPYCDVIYSPQSLMQVKREILESRRRYYQLKQPLGLNTLRQLTSDFRHPRVTDHTWQDTEHGATQDQPPFVDEIPGPKISKPTQYENNCQHNDGVANDGDENRHTQKTNMPLKMLTDEIKDANHGSGGNDNNFKVSLWSHADQVLTIAELERAAWQIASNCVMFNAPESYYPNTARQFAKSCSKILARWCKEHLQCF